MFMDGPAGTHIRCVCAHPCALSEMVLGQAIPFQITFSYFYFEWSDSTIQHITMFNVFISHPLPPAPPCLHRSHFPDCKLTKEMATGKLPNSEM